MAISFPIVETVVNFITAALRDGGLPAVVLLMAVESFGIPPLPSEVILPFTGFLVASGDLSFGGAVAAALLGGLLGSYAAYAVGRWGRHWIAPVGGGPSRLRLDPRHLESMDRFFARWGEGTVGIARLLPVVRSYISYPAGTARMSPVKFGAYTLVGSLPFTVALIYVGFVLRANWDAIVPAFRILDYVAAAFIVLALAYIALRWRNVVSGGFPPRFIPSSERPRPAEAGRP